MKVSRMVKRFTRLAVLALVVVSTLTATVASAATVVPTNAGFETGDGTGWTELIPSGASISYPSSGAAEGTYYALVKTDGPGSYTRLVQTITANAGDTISGSARFTAGDYVPYDDDARVVIRSGDLNGPIVQFVFYASVCLVGDYGSTGWTQWSYTFPSSGT